jgi:hypothetical protein
MQIDTITLVDPYKVLKRKISIIKELCASTGRNFKDIEFSEKLRKS